MIKNALNNFRKPKGVFRSMCFLILSSAVSAVYVQSEELPILKVKPNKCIALHKGQECYQTVKFRISEIQDEKYCLIENEVAAPLFCWSETSTQIFSFEFVSTQSKTYYLRNESKNKIVAETQISVAWVYKSTKKPTSGWRLF